MRWDSAVQKSTKAEEEYKKCCDTIKKSIGMRRFTIRQLIAECEKGKNQHQKEWDEKQEIIQRVKEKKRQIKQDVYEETVDADFRKRMRKTGVYVRKNIG